MRAPEFWTRTDVLSKLISAALAPIGWIYGATIRWRMRHALPMRPHARVICVGNLTVGGTGKTPVTGMIAHLLAERGLRVFILSRGYGGRASKATIVDSEQDSAEDVGDESLILSHMAPVIVARDRREGAALADKRKADVIVMDDGHQNFLIEKDLSLVVVDAETGFGNRRIVPAGPLREPVAQGLARADAMVLIGDGNPQFEFHERPVLRAHLASMSVPIPDGQKVIAFAGIGRPDKFFQSVRATGATVVRTQAFPDHHRYTAAEIARLRARARAEQAELVTTEKDYVRLTSIERDGILVLPVEARFEDLSQLMSLLDRIGIEAVAPVPA